MDEYEEGLRDFDYFQNDSINLKQIKSQNQNQNESQKMSESEFYSNLQKNKLQERQNKINSLKQIFDS